jgi:hypothetical protein
MRPVHELPHKDKRWHPLHGGPTPATWQEGYYEIDSPVDGGSLHVIASAQEGWDHVSVSRTKRCPNWPEMCFIKNLFWRPSEWVVQYHRAESKYVNNHTNCLHMWKPHKDKLPIPPEWMV